MLSVHLRFRFALGLLLFAFPPNQTAFGQFFSVDHSFVFTDLAQRVTPGVGQAITDLSEIPDSPTEQLLGPMSMMMMMGGDPFRAIGSADRRQHAAYGNDGNSTGVKIFRSQQTSSTPGGDVVMESDFVADADPFITMETTITNQGESPTTVQLLFEQATVGIGIDVPLRFESQLEAEVFDTNNDGAASVASVSASYGRGLSDADNPSLRTTVNTRVGGDTLLGLEPGSPENSSNDISDIPFSNLDIEFLEERGIPLLDSGTVSMSSNIFIESLSAGDSVTLEVPFFPVDSLLRGLEMNVFLPPANSLDCSGDGLVTLDDLVCMTAETRDATLSELNLPLGDFDGANGTVFPDFLVLSRNFGTAVDSYVNGDIDINGRVEFVDFLLFSRNFGEKTAVAFAVPEPSFMPAILSLCFSLLRFRQTETR